MGLDRLLVTISGILAIAFTYWFFLMKKEEEVVAKDEIGIIVDGGYSPGNIVVRKGKTTKLTFLRKDPSDCLEDVVLSDFKIRKHLTLNQKVTVAITPAKTGEFDFSCGMNMFHGKLIVRD